MENIFFYNNLKLFSKEWLLQIAFKIFCLNAMNHINGVSAFIQTFIALDLLNTGSNTIMHHANSW